MAAHNPIHRVSYPANVRATDVVGAQTIIDTRLVLLECRHHTSGGEGRGTSPLRQVFISWISGKWIFATFCTRGTRVGWQLDGRISTLSACSAKRYMGIRTHQVEYSQVRIRPSALLQRHLPLLLPNLLIVSLPLILSLQRTSLARVASQRPTSWGHGH
jgi:hypothetical protein